MKKLYLIFSSIILSSLFVNVVFAAPTTTFSRNVFPETDSNYSMGTSTKAWGSTTSDRFCLTDDTCISLWPSGGGVGGNGFFSATSSFVRALTVTDGVTTSSLYANQFNVATSTINNLGLFGVDSSGNTSVSGTLKDFGLATLLGGFISNASSSISSGLNINGNLSASSSITLAGNIIPSVNGTPALGAYGNAFGNIFSSGTIYVGTANTNTQIGNGAITLTGNGSDAATIAIGFAGLDTTFTAPTGGSWIFASNLLTEANTTIGDATSTDILYLNSRIGSSFIPTVNNSIDLGEYDRAARSLYVSSSIFIGGGQGAGAEGLTITADPKTNTDKLFAIRNFSCTNLFTFATSTIGFDVGNSVLNMYGGNGGSNTVSSTVISSGGIIIGSAFPSNLMGSFFVDTRAGGNGDTFTSGTLQAYGLTTLLGGFISNSSSSISGGLNVNGNLSASSSITLGGNIIPSTNNAYNLGAYGSAFAKLFASSTVAIGGGQGVGAEGLSITTDPKTSTDKIFAIRDYLGNDLLTFASSSQSFDANNFNLNIKGGTNGATLTSSTAISSGMISAGSKFPNFLSGLFLVDTTSGGNGSISTSGTLQTYGLSTLLGGFISNASSSISSGLQVAGALNASSTFNLASGFFQIDFSSCSDTTNSKVLWNSTTGQFSCGTDQNGGGSFTGFASFPYFTTNGVVTSSLYADSFYVATSTTNNLGLFNVDSSGNINSSGTLTVLNSNGTSTVVSPTAFTFAKQSGSYNSGLFNIDSSGNLSASGSLNISGGFSPTGSIVKPTLLLSASLTTSVAQSIYVSGDYAYIPTSSDNTVEIYNIASSTVLKKIGSYANGVSGSIVNNPQRIFVQGNYMYITNSGSTDSLEIADISNPSLPKHVGNIASSTVAGASAPALAGPDALWVSGNYAYVVATSTKAMVIIDISNPAQPVQKGIIKSDVANGYASSYQKGVNGIQVQGKYAYQCTGNDGLDIFDVSDPASPVFASGGLGNCLNHIGNNTYVLGSYAYVSDGNGNINIYDVSNPQSEKFVTQFSYTGAQSLSATGNFIYMGKTGGIDIIDTSNKLFPKIVSSLNLSGNPVVRYSFPLGNFVYLISNSALYKVDISGASISNANIGFLESSYFQVNAGAKFLQDASVLGGLSVGGSTQLSSDVSIGGGFASSSPSSSSTVFTNGRFNFGVGTGFNSGVFSLDSTNGGNVSASGTLTVFSTSTFSNILSTAVTSTGRVFFNNITAASSNDFLCRSATTGEIIDGGVTTCAASSRRYKHDITDLRLNAIDTVMKFKSKEYLLNSDNSPHIHFIAEDMFDIDPRLAGVDKQGVVQTIDDNAVLAVLSQAFQDEHIIINTQGDKLKKLEKTVEKQQKQINLLIKKQWKK